MKFAKTFCKPGSYVEIAPAGLRVTLQYNQHGLLEKIRDGGKDDAEFDKDEFIAIRNLVPAKIPLSGGTTFVDGILHSNDIPYECEGIVPDCYHDYYVKRILAGNYFKFGAGNAESYAAHFAGPLVTRNWFGIAGFTPLVGIVVPIKFTEQSLQHALLASSSDIKFPYLSGFYIFEDGETRWEPSCFRQLLVKSVDKKINENGYMIALVHSQSGSRTIFNYSVIAQNDIQENTSILYEHGETLEVLAARNNIDGKDRPALSTSIQCPVCGKVYPTRSNIQAICDDPNCLSRNYPRAKRMLSMLGLPELSYQDYKDHVHKRDIIAITDILLLPQYKDVKPTVTLAQALDAITPVNVCSNSAFYSKLVNSCNKSVESLLYYLGNPTRIITELGVNNIQTRVFVNWILEPSNLLDVQTLLTCVNIKEQPTQFEGAPIFRNQSFMLTGRFIRGTYEYVASVIESYSGKVYASLDDGIPNCVITGSTYEGIDGNLIKQARDLNIPIYDENMFFGNFDIDSDIAQNLL